MGAPHVHFSRQELEAFAETAGQIAAEEMGKQLAYLSVANTNGAALLGWMEERWHKMDHRPHARSEWILT